MKTVLLTAAAMGLAISAASAECMGHNKQQSASVDTETTVASVKQLPPPVDESAKAEEATQAE
jgi:hypothetical protein